MENKYANEPNLLEQHALRRQSKITLPRTAMMMTIIRFNPKKETIFSLIFANNIKQKTNTLLYEKTCEFQYNHNQ